MSVWVNGSLVADDQPAVRPDDHGLIVGDGVFETVKVVDGQPFALTRHVARMQRSAAGLGVPLDTELLRVGIKAVLAADAADHKGRGVRRLRMTVTGGPSPYSSDRGGGQPTLMVATAPASTWPATAAVAVVPWVRNDRSAVAGLKTISYAENVVALAHAKAHGAAEAIFANTKGELCEGTGANVFLGIGGRLVTPPLSSGCLAGITRELVIEWLGDVEERDLPLEALAQSDEAFLASSTRDVQPIATVDGRPLPKAPGPLTERASAVFADRSAAGPDP